MNRYLIGTVKWFDQLADCLEKDIQELRLHKVDFTRGRVIHGDLIFFTIELKNQYDLEKVQVLLAKSLAKFLNSTWEMQWIADQIAKEYTYYDSDEVEYLTEKATRYLATYRRPNAGRYRHVEFEQEILTFLQEHSEVNVEGLVRFRLRKYESDRIHAIEYVIDEYLMDKEYQEFVKLLRYFLSIQKSRSPLLHLIIGEDSFRLVDHDGLQITNEDLNQFVEDLIDGDLQQEDMIISTLITFAPSVVQIHISEPLSYAMTLVETVKSVFEDRVHFCQGCTICHFPLDPWGNEYLHNQNLPLDYSK